MGILAVLIEYREVIVMRLWAKAIEAKRKKMSFYVKKQGFSSAKTIRCSQELDKLLLPYEKRVSGRLLSIEKQFDEEGCLIVLSGELDYFSIETFYQTLDNLKRSPFQVITFELSNLKFIDSTGYGALLQEALELCSKGIAIKIKGLKDYQKMFINENLFHYHCMPNLFQTSDV